MIKLVQLQTSTQIEQPRKRFHVNEVNTFLKQLFAQIVKNFLFISKKGVNCSVFVVYNGI